MNARVPFEDFYRGPVARTWNDENVTPQVISSFVLAAARLVRQEGYRRSDVLFPKRRSDAGIDVTDALYVAVGGSASAFIPYYFFGHMIYSLKSFLGVRDLDEWNDREGQTAELIARQLTLFSDYYLIKHGCEEGS